MRVAVPKEIKSDEFRVGLTPASAAALVRRGHSVTVERGAGEGAGLDDAEYQAAGASIADDVEALFAQAELIVKVKEPLEVERKRLRRGQVLFTYLHLAADCRQTLDLVNSGSTCIAYETITSPSGHLPLLTPMSEIAGRLAPQVGAHCLEKSAGGRGILLGGVPGVEAGHVVIIGCGVSGLHAAEIAVGMGASVTALDRSEEALRRAAARFGTRVTTLPSSAETVARALESADLVICAALIPAAVAPKLVTRAMLRGMKSGSVIVDISIDQGGCCETSRPTTHSDPTYTVDRVIHYCVANMPGAVPRTSTFALNNATLPYVLALADKGWQRALREDEYLREGLNIHDGHVTCAPVAEAHGLPYSAPAQYLG
jgi:alanine dehydrogenase